MAFFSAGGEISQKWAGEAVRAGALVIDNSSAFRMQKNIPLVVPEINPHLIPPLKNPPGSIIANPNCSTIQLVLTLYPLQKAFGLDLVFVASYQSLSGAGRKALHHFKQDSLSLLTSPPGSEKPLNREEAFNCIPFIGSVEKEGAFSTEEIKIMQESRKILETEDLKIAATTVRVPTFNGHGEVVSLFLKQATSREKLLKALNNQQGLKVSREGHPPLNQRFIEGKKDVYVGRIRALPESRGRGWMMWIMADNLRKGAALNGLQIAEVSSTKQ